jgi:hypothetical protein
MLNRANRDAKVRPSCPFTRTRYPSRVGTQCGCASRPDVPLILRGLSTAPPLCLLIFTRTDAHARGPDHSCLFLLFLPSVDWFHFYRRQLPQSPSPSPWSIVLAIRMKYANPMPHRLHASPSLPCIGSCSSSRAPSHVRSLPRAEGVGRGGRREEKREEKRER